MSAKLFESALGITDPWFIDSVKFDEAAKTLTVLINFKAGNRFNVKQRVIDQFMFNIFE